jgi:hypothetical protein
VKSTRSFFVVLALTCFLPLALHAQTAGNTREAVNNEKQITVDKHQIARDSREVENFERLLREFDTMLEAGSVESCYRINTRLRVAMDRELEQARAKTGQAKREVAQSRREKRREYQEAHASGLASDYNQLFDDRRDLRDDKRDTRAATVRMNRMDSIIAMTNVLQPTVRDGNADALAETRRLMGEFLEVLRADLAASKAELVEDRGERREDRGERRTDGRK